MDLMMKLHVYVEQLLQNAEVMETYLCPRLVNIHSKLIVIAPNNS